jgi:hypothetical protein
MGGRQNVIEMAQGPSSLSPSAFRVVNEATLLE